MTIIQIHGGHDRGSIDVTVVMPNLTGRPRLTPIGHYEWDHYVLRPLNGEWVYVWAGTRACCYNARLEGSQPVAPHNLEERVDPGLSNRTGVDR